MTVGAFPAKEKRLLFFVHPAAVAAYLWGRD